MKRPRKPPIWVTDKTRKKCASQCCNNTVLADDYHCIRCNIKGWYFPRYEHIKKIGRPTG